MTDLYNIIIFLTVKVLYKSVIIIIKFIILELIIKEQLFINQQINLCQSYNIYN
jgi:hypothetical protein